METSKSLPSNLARVHKEQISGSASYQSYLSGAGSVHRVRNASGPLSEQLSLDGEKSGVHALESGLGAQHHTGSLTLARHFVTDPVGFLVDGLRRLRNGHFWRLRTLATLYCCLSVLLFSLRLRGVCLENFTLSPLQTAPVKTSTSLSPLRNISVSQRLSIAFRTLPPPAHLDAFVTRGRYSELNLTACFWTEDLRVEAALAAASDWPGPVSLVVVTTAQPNGTKHNELLAHIAKSSTSNVSSHVLHVFSITSGSFNAYVNLARFFSQTPQVILFPGDLPLASTHARLLEGLGSRKTHLLVVSNATHKAFAFSADAPVILPRDSPIWCTERFYLFGSRTLDWEDCLWQLWLESAGDASSTAIPGLLRKSRSVTTPLVSPHAMKVRRRWSSKYRAEACAFALKRSQALETLTKLERGRMQWRKRFCRETLLDLGATELV